MPQLADLSMVAQPVGCQLDLFDGVWEDRPMRRFIVSATVDIEFVTEAEAVVEHAKEHLAALVRESLGLFSLRTIERTSIVEVIAAEDDGGPDDPDADDADVAAEGDSAEGTAA